MKATQVIAVIIVFEPELKILHQLVLATAQQVESIVIVNNSSEISLNDFLPIVDTPIQLITFPENMGIAYAQNIGIEYAISQKAQYVLLLDQDSIPSTGMTRALIECINSNPNAIAAGARHQDPRSNITPKFIVSRFGIPARKQPLSTSLSIRAHTLISSGMLIRLEYLLHVGGMRSNYFIDLVDIEWCLRAIHKGYLLLGSSHAFMEHTIGLKAQKIWIPYPKTISLHSPLRHYYMVRNLILMLRDTSMNIAWKASYLIRIAQFFLFFSLFSMGKGHFKMMCLGLWHGIENQRGRLNLPMNTCTQLPGTVLDPLAP
jgi:rhamnosyltransferase